MIRYLSQVPVVVLSLMTQGAHAHAHAHAHAQPPADSSQPFFVDLSCGKSHTCAMQADGALTCTQASAASRPAPPDNLPAFVDNAAC